VLPAAYVTHCVEVTSATADSYGYPARIVTFDGSTWARTYEACRAVKIGGGTLPTGYHLGRLVRADPSGMHVYGVEPIAIADLVPPGLPYSVLWTDSSGNVIAWTDYPEVVQLTARSQAVIGVANNTTGILKFKDEFSSRSFDIQAHTQGASQSLNLPQSLPTVRQFLQAYTVAGADVQAKWVGLNAATVAYVAQGIVGTLSNWEQIRFTDDLFDIRDGTTYPIVDLKSGASNTLLWTGAGGVRPAWSATPKTTTFETSDKYKNAGSDGITLDFSTTANAQYKPVVKGGIVTNNVAYTPPNGSHDSECDITGTGWNDDTASPAYIGPLSAGTYLFTSSIIGALLLSEDSDDGSQAEILARYDRRNGAGTSQQTYGDFLIVQATWNDTLATQWSGDQRAVDSGPMTAIITAAEGDKVYLQFKAKATDSGTSPALTAVIALAEILDGYGVGGVARTCWMRLN
jgi:hypothetical protein